MSAILSLVDYCNERINYFFISHYWRKIRYLFRRKCWNILVTFTDLAFSSPGIYYNVLYVRISTLSIEVENRQNLTEQIKIRSHFQFCKNTLYRIRIRSVRICVHMGLCIEEGDSENAYFKTRTNNRKMEKKKNTNFPSAFSRTYV